MMINFISKLKPYAPVVVRVGLSLVFLWFGSNQLINPAGWTGIVPSWASGIFGGNATTVIFLNGWFEIVAGLMLIFGLQVRIISILLAGHLLGISTTFGFSPIGIRDLGLTIATLSIFFAGPDVWSVDTWFEKKSSQSVPNL